MGTHPPHPSRSTNGDDDDDDDDDDDVACDILILASGYIL